MFLYYLRFIFFHRVDHHHKQSSIVYRWIQTSGHTTLPEGLVTHGMNISGDTLNSYSTTPISWTIYNRTYRRRAALQHAWAGCFTE